MMIVFIVSRAAVQSRLNGTANRFFFLFFFLYSDWAGSINYRSVRLKVGRMGDHLSHVLMVASQLANKISAIFYMMEKYTIVHRRFNIKTHPLETGCVY